MQLLDLNSLLFNKVKDNDQDIKKDKKKMEFVLWVSAVYDPVLKQLGRELSTTQKQTMWRKALAHQRAHNEITYPKSQSTLECSLTFDAENQLQSHWQYRLMLIMTVRFIVCLFLKKHSVLWLTQSRWCLRATSVSSNTSMSGRKWRSNKKLNYTLSAQGWKKEINDY